MMLAPGLAIQGLSFAVREGLWAFLCWLVDAVSHEVIPLTGDPDVDAMLIEVYLRGQD